MTTIGEMTLEDAATQAAGNWKRFGCFVWDRDARPRRPRRLGHHLHPQPGQPPARPEQRRRHRQGHGALHRGRRPRRGDGEPFATGRSATWTASHPGLPGRRDHRRLPDLPRPRRAARRLPDPRRRGLRRAGVCGDAREHRRRRLAAEGRVRPARGLGGRRVLAGSRDHRQRAVENRDDQGGYPEEDDLRAAFEALGYERLED